MIRSLQRCTVIKPKTWPLLAVPEMFTFWTLTFHMTGTVFESVNLVVSHLNPGNMMECVLGEKRGLCGDLFLWGVGAGLSVMRSIVLGHNKANMCTSSAVMEEPVCLSSKWNILEASNPAG